MQTEEQFKTWLGDVAALFAKAELCQRNEERLIFYMLDDTRYKQVIGIGKFSRRELRELESLRVKLFNSLPKLLEKAYTSA